MTTKKMAMIAGITYVAMRNRKKMHPELTEEQLILPEKEFKKLVRSGGKNTQPDYTTSDGVAVNLRELAANIGLTYTAVKKRTSGEIISYEELTRPSHCSHGFIKVKTPYGVLSLWELEQYVNVSRKTMYARWRVNNDITFEELTRESKRFRNTLEKEAKREPNFDDYTWSELTQWYKDRGKYCDNAVEILRDMCRLKTNKDANPILKRLEAAVRKSAENARIAIQ